MQMAAVLLNSLAFDADLCNQYPGSISFKVNKHETCSGALIWKKQGANIPGFWKLLILKKVALIDCPSESFLQRLSQVLKLCFTPR